MYETLSNANVFILNILHFTTDNYQWKYFCFFFSDHLFLIYTIHSLTELKSNILSNIFIHIQYSIKKKNIINKSRTHTLAHMDETKETHFLRLFFLKCAQHSGPPKKHSHTHVSFYSSFLFFQLNFSQNIKQQYTHNHMNARIIKKNARIHTTLCFTDQSRPSIQSEWLSV